MKKLIEMIKGWFQKPETKEQPPGKKNNYVFVNWIVEPKNEK